MTSKQRPTISCKHRPLCDWEIPPTPLYLFNMMLSGHQRRSGRSGEEKKSFTLAGSRTKIPWPSTSVARVTNDYTLPRWTTVKLFPISFGSSKKDCKELVVLQVYIFDTIFLFAKKKCSSPAVKKDVCSSFEKRLPVLLLWNARCIEFCQAIYECKFTRRCKGTMKHISRS